jgi:hypothetical protein
MDTFSGKVQLPDINDNQMKYREVVDKGNKEGDYIDSKVHFGFFIVLLF